MTAVNEERLDFTLTLTPALASAFLESLDRRLEALRAALSGQPASQASAEAVRERDALIAVMMAWEKAIRSPGRAREAERLFGPSKLTFLERAEAEAREALTGATDKLAQARAALSSSLATEGEERATEAAEAVGAKEAQLDLAQSTYDEAAGRVREAKGREAEDKRIAAYARSQRAHDEAIAVLRKYEPLALEMLKLFGVLSAHTDLALADVEAAEEARTDSRTTKAIGRLEAALQAHGQNQTEEVRQNLTEALRELKSATE
jgi:hypothetical protein